MCKVQSTHIEFPWHSSFSFYFIPFLFSFQISLLPQGSLPFTVAQLMHEKFISFPFCLSTFFPEVPEVSYMLYVLCAPLFLAFFFYYPLLHKLFSSTDVRSNHYPSIHYSSAENNSILGRGKSEGNKGLQMCFLGGRVVQWLALSNCS